MLADLRIENLAVVEQVRAHFEPGLNVISGETGAGKTILLAALSLALGGRASSDLVRVGTDSAVIEARFSLAGAALARVTTRLDELGLPSAGGELIVRRLVSADGKSRVYLNDASATVGALAQVTDDLVELTGQHDQFGLLRARRHQTLLDAFAQNDLAVARVAEAVRTMRAGREARDALRERLLTRVERDEFLRFYLSEFERLDPRPGEEAELIDEAHRLRHADRLRTGLAAVLDNLYEGEVSAYDLVARARATLDGLVGADPRLEAIAAEIEGLQSGLDELARRVTHHVAEARDEPERLEEVEARLHQLQRFCRKHGGDLDEVIAKMEAARAELAELGDLELRLEETERALGAATKTAVELALELSKRRRDAIPRLVEATRQHLSELGFDGVRFEIALETDDHPETITETGADRVEFLLSTNPGQAARRLNKVASGGELSRTLLALKCALAGADTAPIQVLDEIDTGIGGATAEIVGRKIRQLADRSQVLCVTHLPQIASFADNHLVVTKTSDEGVTRTRLRHLQGPDREDEVARMLGGTEITQTTRDHAREMLDRARVAG